MKANKYKSFRGTENDVSDLKSIIAPFKDTMGNLNPVLQKIHDVYGYVDPDMQKIVGEELGLPQTAVASVQSFYALYRDTKPGNYVIRLCNSTPCHAKESAVILEAFEEKLGIKPGETTEDGRFTLLTTGCIGACEKAPAALVNDCLFGPLTPEDVGALLDDIDNRMYSEKEASLSSYLNNGGFRGLKKALSEPSEIINTISASGLRGRSGSGFPVGTKWTTTFKASDKERYIVCNADEGEPETSKDRSIIASNPFSIIEGMTIAAVAVGAGQGFIYLRGEYRIFEPVLRAAIEEAKKAGYLGKNICGSNFDFDIDIRLGAGAYICGEETALLESIEGRRGNTRLKPPFPGEVGLWEHPTIINNVETLSNVSTIMRNGAEAYRLDGTEKCPGIKKMTLSGNINRPGVYDIPMGTKVSDILEKFGKGLIEGKKLKAIQTGGGSGTIVGPDFLNASFDIEGAAAAGGFFGTGDLFFITEDQELLPLVKNMTEFFVDESCGKCAPCRIGIVRVVDLLDKFIDGKARKEDIEKLSELAEQIKATSRCALGTAAVTPVASAIKNFLPEFENGLDRRCF